MPMRKELYPKNWKEIAFQIKQKANTNNKHFRYCLVFDNNYISFKIAFFETKSEAEYWRDFLAYTTQEFKYDEMKIIEK